MHNIISGTWTTKAQSYIGKTSKILNLVGYLQPYLHKDGLKDAKEDMILLIDYITDNIGDLVPPVSVFWYRQFTLSDFSYRLSGTAPDTVH